MLEFLKIFVEKYPFPVTDWFLQFRMILYTILIGILLLLTYFFLDRSKKEEETNGLTNPLLKYYMASYFGILLISLNVFLSSLSLYLSGGKLIMFGAYKAILYNLGTLILIIGLVNLSFSIIYFNEYLLLLLKSSYYAAVLLATTGQFIVLAEALGFTHGLLTPKLSLILSVGGLLYLVVLIVSILGLVQQLKYNASPIERLRIKLVAITFVIQIIQLIARVGALMSASNQFIFNIFSFIIYPIIDFVGYPISLVLLLSSIYTPQWLQIRTNIIPKEYANIV